MTRVGISCLLFFSLGCRHAPSGPPAQIVAVPDAPRVAKISPEGDPATPPSPPPSVAFIEKPGGVLQWDFVVKGLPATDRRTGELVVADVSHGYIASSLSLAIRWYRPGEKEPSRTFIVLDGNIVSKLVYDDDEPDAETSKLVIATRERTREANELLAGFALRPTIPCSPIAAEEGLGCEYPQRFTCGTFAAEADEATIGFKVPPQIIGDGPPHEMITCIHEAHLDPVTRVLAARVDISCKGGGSDARYSPDEWRAIRLR